MPVERAIFSGSGGQGLMFIGKLFAQMAVDAFPHITFMPSYGAEVRGGTSHCRIVLANEEIASPVVEVADSIVVMNQPSLDRFRSALRPGGLIVFTASLAAPPADASALGVPATEWALEIGDLRIANVVMLGAYLQRKNFFPYAAVEAAIASFSAAKGDRARRANLQALRKGWEAAGEQAGPSVATAVRGEA